MKRIWVLVFPFALVAITGLPQPPGAEPVFSTAAVAEAAGFTKVLCVASCGGGTTVSCSYNPPSVCTAVDRDCSANQRGFVTCNGVTTFCPTACPVCTEGAIRLLSGGCCDNGGRRRLVQQCIGGRWVTTDEICGIPCGPPLP